MRRILVPLFLVVVGALVLSGYAPDVNVGRKVLGEMGMGDKLVGHDGDPRMVLASQSYFNINYDYPSQWDNVVDPTTIYTQPDDRAITDNLYYRMLAHNEINHMAMIYINPGENYWGGLTLVDSVRSYVHPDSTSAFVFYVNTTSAPTNWGTLTGTYAKQLYDRLLDWDGDTNPDSNGFARNVSGYVVENGAFPNQIPYNWCAAVADTIVHYIMLGYENSGNVADWTGIYQDFYQFPHPEPWFHANNSFLQHLDLDQDAQEYYNGTDTYDDDDVARNAAFHHALLEGFTRRLREVHGNDKFLLVANGPGAVRSELADSLDGVLVEGFDTNWPSTEASWLTYANHIPDRIGAPRVSRPIIMYEAPGTDSQASNDSSFYTSEVVALICEGQGAPIGSTTVEPAKGRTGANAPRRLAYLGAPADTATITAYDGDFSTLERSFTYSEGVTAYAKVRVKNDSGLETLPWPYIVYVLGDTLSRGGGWPRASEPLVFSSFAVSQGDTTADGDSVQVQVDAVVTSAANVQVEARLYGGSYPDTTGLTKSTELTTHDYTRVLTITAPTWAADSSLTFSFTPGGGANIDHHQLDYQLNGGSWTTLSNTIAAAATSYDWTAARRGRINARIRAENAAETTVSEWVYLGAQHINQARDIYARGIANRGAGAARAFSDESNITYTAKEPAGESGSEKSRMITVDADSVSATCTNFPLLVLLDEDWLETTGNGGDVSEADGDDIYFTSDSAGNTVMDFEVVTYDGSEGAGTIEAWVLIPSLSSSADTEIYMWYGDDTQTDSLEDLDGTWTDYSFVHHMQDSTSSYWTSGDIVVKNHGTVALGTGKIGGGLDFNDVGSLHVWNGSPEMDIAPGDAEADITYQCLFNADTAPTHAFLMTYTQEFQGGATLVARDDTPSRNMSWETLPTTAFMARATATYSTDAWHMAVGTYNEDGGSSVATVYLDGAEHATDTSVASPYPEDGRDPGGIGVDTRDGRTDTDYRLDGLMDEVRVRKSFLSGQWVRTEWSCWNWPTTFSTVGAER